MVFVHVGIECTYGKNKKAYLMEKVVSGVVQEWT